MDWPRERRIFREELVRTKGPHETERCECPAVETRLAHSTSMAPSGVEEITVEVKRHVVREVE